MIPHPAVSHSLTVLLCVAHYRPPLHVKPPSFVCRTVRVGSLPAGKPLRLVHTSCCLCTRAAACARWSPACKGAVGSSGGRRKSTCHHAWRSKRATRPEPAGKRCRVKGRASRWEGGRGAQRVVLVSLPVSCTATLCVMPGALAGTHRLYEMTRREASPGWTSNALLGRSLFSPTTFALRRACGPLCTFE